MSRLEQIHAVELDILKVCRDVCEKHNISYWLAYGSALGAVRYKGFIPWDDDIDIMMPEEEIEKFRKCFIEDAPKEYFLSDVSSEKYCTYSWLKIRRTDTSSMPVRYKTLPVNWGICIDIFPVYRIKESDFKKALSMFKLANKMLFATWARFETGVNPVRKLIAILPTSLRRKIAAREMKKINSLEKGEFYFDGWYAFPKEIINGEKTVLAFESEEFSVPSDCDKYLSMIYGDYMTPPPENERGGHESEIGDIIWSTEKSYKEFL